MSKTTIIQGSKCPECGSVVRQHDNRKPTLRWVPSHCDEDGTGHETVVAGEVAVECTNHDCDFMVVSIYD